MPYWLHSIFGFILAAAASSVAVTLVLLGWEPLFWPIKPQAFLPGFVIVCLSGFPGFAYVVFKARHNHNQPFGYFTIAGMKNSIFATFLFLLYSAFTPFPFAIVALLPIFIPGGALGGYVYGLFRKHVPCRLPAGK